MNEVYKTYGEAFVGRALAMENRGGVPHYKPGQESVTIEYGRDEEEGGTVYAAVYDFVNQMGQVVRMLFIYDVDHWVPLAFGTCQVVTPPMWRQPPECFTPSEEMLAALNAKLDEVKRDA